MADESSLAEEKRSRKRREKRSLAEARNRRLLFRTLSYAWPYWRSILAAIAITAFSSLIGGLSLLVMIPVIEKMVNPQIVVEQEQQAKADRRAAEQRIDALEDARERGAEAMAAFNERLPWLSELDARSDKLRSKINEEINGFLVDRGFSAVKYLVLIIFGASLIKAAIDYASRYMLTKVIFRAIQHIKVDLYSAVLGLDLGSFTDRTSGNLLARMSADVTKINMVMRAMLGQSLSMPFQILTTLLVLFIINFKISLAVVIGLPLIAIPIFVISKKLRHLSKLDAEEDAYLVDVMQETVQGLPIVKAFTSESRERARFRTVAKAQVRRQIRRMRLAIAGPVIMEVLVTGASCLVVFAGAYVVIVMETMNLAELTIYLAALQRFYKPMKTISSSYMRVQRGLASAERVFEIVDTEPLVREKPDAVDMPPFQDEIEFRNVTFAYGNDREIVLSDFTLTLPKGSTVALVGETGSGKSTVTKLLPRFYDPIHGLVKVDGCDIRNFRIKSLRDQISMVTQDTILFDSTIAENIAYGRPEATAEEIEDVARAANIHDFILSLPEGYATRIGERGGRLSGGQRQRLAIARALLRDAPILILDEATSALDTETEKSIQEALVRLMEHRTVLVVAHRLSTVRRADKIVVLDQGRIVEQGAHEELLARGGRYAALNLADTGELDGATTPTPQSDPGDFDREASGDGDELGGEFAPAT